MRDPCPGCIYSHHGQQKKRPVDRIAIAVVDSDEIVQKWETEPHQADQLRRGRVIAKRFPEAQQGEQADDPSQARLAPSDWRRKPESDGALDGHPDEPARMAANVIQDQSFLGRHVVQLAHPRHLGTFGRVREGMITGVDAGFLILGCYQAGRFVVRDLQLQPQIGTQREEPVDRDFVAQGPGQYQDEDTGRHPSQVARRSTAAAIQAEQAARCQDRGQAGRNHQTRSPKQAIQQTASGSPVLRCGAAKREDHGQFHGDGDQAGVAAANF